jgi:flagellar motility protein MotE (MotC chaperone)
VTSFLARVADNLRMLPVLLVAFGVLFGFKVDAVFRGLSDWAIATSAVAEEAKAKPEPAPARATPTEPEKPDPSGARTGDGRRFSEAEIEILQSLSRRREELDTRARDLDTREAVLAAAQKRIDEKLDELKALERRIGGLVKVYETMKPKDAARIFETLDMEILEGVAVRMKEQKIAPILAEMASERAKDLTVRLANATGAPRSGG